MVKQGVGYVKNTIVMVNISLTKNSKKYEATVEVEKGKKKDERKNEETSDEEERMKKKGSGGKKRKRTKK